jgi:hypothetical protein
MNVTNTRLYYKKNGKLDFNRILSDGMSEHNKKLLNKDKAKDSILNKPEKQRRYYKLIDERRLR